MVTLGFCEAIDWWEKLAAQQDKLAGDALDRDEYAGAYAERARTYRAAAQALRLEAEHGEPYCACHLRPIRVHLKPC